LLIACSYWFTGITSQNANSQVLKAQSLKK